MLQSAMAQLRADPVLSKVLDKPSVQQALLDLKADPSRLAKYKNDPDVMQVVTRLLNIGRPQEDLRPYEDLRTSPAEVAVSIMSNKRLAKLLNDPRVRRAVSEISRDSRAMARYQDDVEVLTALDLLQEQLGVVDTSATPAAGRPPSKPQ